MNKIEIKKKRREVLLTINRMSRLCSCKPDVERVQDRCRNCRDMSKLGKQLDQLLVERRKTAIKDSKYKDNRKFAITWTEAMEDELRKLAKEYKSHEIGRMMGMTTVQISNKCSKLGISCKRGNVYYKFYEDGKFITEGSVKDISDVTGIRKNVLYKYAAKDPISINRRMVLI